MNKSEIQDRIEELFKEAKAITEGNIARISDGIIWDPLDDSPTLKLGWWNKVKFSVSLSFRIYKFLSRLYIWRDKKVSYRWQFVAVVNEGQVISDLELGRIGRK
jgi:hypothetical protein